MAIYASSYKTTHPYAHFYRTFRKTSHQFSIRVFDTLTPLDFLKLKHHPIHHVLLPVTKKLGTDEQHALSYLFHVTQNDLLLAWFLCIGIHHFLFTTSFRSSQNSVLNTSHVRVCSSQWYKGYFEII